MPTARELLEQADALMRRNRAAAADAARAEPQPGTAGWTAPAPRSTSPRTIQREPIPPSAVRTALPDPTDSLFPMGVPPTARGLVTGERAPVVPPPRLETPVGEVPSKPNDMPHLTQPVETAPDDDVPLLTDVVEEIDVPIVDEQDRGAPSIWDLATRGDASVLGRGPDSLSSLMPTIAPRDVPQEPPKGRDPLGLDQPAPGFDVPPPLVEEVAATPPAPPEEEAEAPAIDRLDAQEVSPPASVADTSADEAVVVADEWSPVDESLLPPPAAEEVAPAPVASQAAPSASVPTDEARIREIAEEIGMQVLQRIDIFSDTTLPAQLGERLKPVVERASADLVAAINQHVGELLRAYIAEAIAREIESWRKDRQ